MRLNKKIFVITGPSAVGKTTIVKALLDSGLPLARIITTTSRAKREGEIRDASYHFVTREEFEKLINNQQMFEWAEYAGNYYGSQKADVDKVLNSSKHPLWIVDTQGADFFKKTDDDAVVIFITPSSFSILRKRLEVRKLPGSYIRQRLKAAQEEMKQAPRYDYRVINYDGKLIRVVEEVKKIIKQEIG